MAKIDKEASVRMALFSKALAAALAAASSVACAVDLKGLREGSSERDLLAVHQDIKCQAERPPRAGMPAPRSCIARNFTVAGAPATNARFVFYRDKLALFFIELDQADYLDVARALRAKLGTPDPVESRPFDTRLGTPIGGEVLIWQNGSTRLRLGQGEAFREPVRLWMSSALADQWQREIADKRAGGKPDV